MMGPWLQALQEADANAAEVLAAHADSCGQAPTVAADDAAALVRAWLEKHFPQPNMVIVPGASQADLIETLLAQKTSCNILWIDQDHPRLVAALHAHTSPAVVEAIRSGRLQIDPGESEDASIERFLRAADFSRVPCIRVLEARPLDEADLNMALEMTHPSRDLLRMQACDMSTRLTFGQAWQDQTLRNLPDIIRHPGVNTLFGKFSDMPALVVAAGPSLQEVLPYISRVRSRVLLISVGRVLRTLIHRAGLVPDLAVTGDGQAFVARHFENKPEGIPVAASCFTEPTAIEQLDKMFFMDITAMGMPEWLEEKIGPRGEIYPGGNVATTAISLAVNMGCKTVFMAGMDLSYAPDGGTHYTSRKITDDATGKPAIEKLYDVPGNYQPWVKTNRQMMHYIDFTKDYLLANPDVAFYNINTAGARIEGAELVRPEELPERVPKKPVNAAGRIARIYAAHADDVDVGRFRQSLQDDIKALKTLQQECCAAAMRCNQMIMLMRRPGLSPDAREAARELMVGLEPLDQRMKDDPVMNLIEARLEKQTRILSQKMLSPQELALDPAVRSHRRWRDYYQGVAQASRETETLLEKVLDRLKPSPDKTLPSLPENEDATMEANPFPFNRETEKSELQEVLI